MGHTRFKLRRKIMNKTKLILASAIIFMMIFSPAVFGKLKVVTSYRYISDVAGRIGGDEISAIALSKGSRDPHFITPKPSFISKMRRADLLIINGGQLEIGWIPPILRKANNPKIVPGSEGFLDLFSFIRPIEVPTDVSRAQGDIHPDGNPHFALNPDNIALIAKAIKNKLAELLPEKNKYFEDNLNNFLKKWEERSKYWEEELKKFSGKNIIQYHKNFDYFIEKYNLNELGTLEPVPGIPPTSKQIEKIITLVKNRGGSFLLHDVYHNQKASKYVAKRCKIKMVILPHDVGSVPGAKDIFSLFDEIVRRLSE